MPQTNNHSLGNAQATLILLHPVASTARLRRRGIPLPYHPIRQFSNLTTEQILANASHEIDILQSLLGDISTVYAVEGRKERGYPVEETVQVVFTFASGVVGSFLFS